MLKGYYEEYSYVIILPNGKKIRVVNDSKDETDGYFEKEDKNVVKSNTD